MGRALVQQFGSLSELARASLEELQTIKGIGRDKAIALQSAFTLARRTAAEIQETAPLMEGPDAIADLLREECRPYAEEHFFYPSRYSTAFDSQGSSHQRHTGCGYSAPA